MLFMIHTLAGIVRGNEPVSEEEIHRIFTRLDADIKNGSLEPLYKPV
jgi:hypothetical protein